MSRIPEVLLRAIHEAAEWNQRLKAGDLDDVQRREYCIWLQSPLHQIEMGRVCLIDALLQLAPLRNEPVWRPDNVIDFESYAPMTRPRVKEPPPPKRKQRLGWKLAAGAVAAGLAIGFVVVVVGRSADPVVPEAVIVTTIGAWDKKLMDDGSVIYAGPNSELTFHSDGQQRSVTFVRGEAFFDVAPDPTHPFVVTTDFGSVRVLGTEFLVAYKGNSVVITVREGKVGVTPKQAPDAMQPAVTLVANQQVVMSSVGLRGPVAVDAEREVMWVRNWYEPHGEMVCEIIQQLNQRHDVEIVVDDPQVCRMRISSLSFRPSEPEDFVQKVNRIYAEYPYREGVAGGTVLRLQQR
jgi:transmembrane sensor